MKVLVTGASGQLGYDVVNELIEKGHNPVAVDIDEIDITNEAKVIEFIYDSKPDAVIHCAAWTAVDAAEDEKNREMVYDINTNGSRYIAKACENIGCKMVYLSTDYVFEGTGDEPMKPSDVCRPVNIYGESKYQGELAVQELLDKYFIVRISWVFGINGDNFVNTMLKLGKTHNELSVVNDQVGTPTYTHDLSKLLINMICGEQYGIYHVTNEGGYISWYDFACEIMQVASSFDSNYKNVNIIPVGSDMYPTKAVRPRNSRLDKNHVNKRFEALPKWQDALSRYIKEVFDFYGKI